MSRISILLPARNAAATMERCLSSIQRQSEPSWECIVIDDGSTDRTASLAACFARRDERFRVTSRDARGLVASLNEGLSLCRSALIARMDADDVMHRDRLKVQANLLDGDRSLDAAGTHVRMFPRETLSPRLREYEDWLNAMTSPDDVARDVFVECPVAHPTMMMRRSFAELGYRENGWPEDYDLVLRARHMGLRIGVAPRRLVEWRKEAGSLSRTDPRYGLDRFTACKAHFIAHGFLATVQDYILCGYGDTGRCLERALEAHGKRPSHIVEVKPGRLGQVIHGATVIPYDALAGMRGPIVVSVARAGPRAEIRRALDGMGFVELRDYICAA
jgi:glycosyltransferase involved in cell wall biosynthesis